VTFTLPAGLPVRGGDVLVDTSVAAVPTGRRHDASSPYTVPGRALALIRFESGVEP
jgi:hypothetical protein